MVNLKNISAGTIARTIVLVLALINQVLTATGHAVLPIDDEQINTLVSTAWTVIAALVAYWKNNSVTPAAIEADKVKQEIKSGKSVAVTEPTTERRENSI